MTQDSVLLERHGSVAVISLNRPERLNAWSPDVTEGLHEKLQVAKTDKDIKGVVLTGVGRAFCAGADLKNPATHSVEDPEEWLETHRGQRTFDALQAFDKPIMAAVNGHAVGIGCLMPLCCDFIFVNENASFCLPQVRLGILPAYGGTLRLARFVGRGNALNIALTGRHVGADEALRMGIATELHSAGELMDKAIATMASIAAMPVHAVRLARESLAFGYESGLPSNEQADNFRFMALAQTKDRADRHEFFRTNKSYR